MPAPFTLEMDKNIFSFKSLEESDFDLVYHWFNQPHVQDFYSLRSWTLEEVQKKTASLPQQRKGSTSLHNLFKEKTYRIYSKLSHQRTSLGRSRSI